MTSFWNKLFSSSNNPPKQLRDEPIEESTRSGASRSEDGNIEESLDRKNNPTKNWTPEQEKKRYVELTSEQLDILEETERSLNRGLSQFKKCLAAFEEKREFLLTQQEVLLKQLQALSPNTIVTPQRTVALEADTDSDEEVDPALREYFEDRPGEEEEEKILDSDDEGVSGLQTQRAKINKDGEIELTDLQIDDEENSVTSRNQPQLLLPEIEENNNNNNNNNNNSEKSPEQLENERRVRGQLLVALKKDIPKLMEQIDRKILSYKVEIKILEEKKNAIEAQRKDAEKSIQPLKSSMGVELPAVTDDEAPAV